MIFQNARLRVFIEIAWFGIWTTIIGSLAWLVGEPMALVPLEALLGGLGALAAYRFLV